jgi:hypothetical protein
MLTCCNIFNSLNIRNSLIIDGNATFRLIVDRLPKPFPGVIVDKDNSDEYEIVAAEREARRD